MRGIRTAGIGLSVALAAHTGGAQDPGYFSAPAARLGKIQAVPDPGSEPAAFPSTLARGQVSAPPTVGTPTSLGMPRPISTPSVTEIRTNPAPSPTSILGGNPAGIGQPVVVGVGQPIPVGQPFPVGQPGTSYPISGPIPGTAPPMGGYPTGSVPGISVPSVLPPGAVMSDPNAPLMGDGSYGYSPTSVLVGGATGTTSGGYNPARLSLHGEYLMWWVRNYSVPPLLTTSSPQYEGIIGQGNTQVITPTQSFTNTLHSGFRFGGTYWLGQRRVWGLDSNLFFLGSNQDSFTASSTQYPVLARPFYNVNNMQNDSEIIGFPGFSSGFATIDMDTQMWGADINARRKMICNPCSNIDLLLGARFFRLSDSLNITEVASLNPGVQAQSLDGGPVRTFGVVQDQFTTTNEFYGPQVGLAGEFRRGRWIFGGRATVAMGTVFQTVEINGAQYFRLSDGTAGAAAGGLLAVPGGNIGQFSQNKFGIMPELGLQIGYQMTQHWRFTIGYNFLYLNSVVRPGDQIDTGLDVTRIPNFPLRNPATPLAVPRPAAVLKESDFFAQGISFGLQWIW